MGASRPSLVVQRYQELFSQSRVEAFEAIELLDELEDDQFVSEILLDILKVRLLHNYVRKDGHDSTVNKMEVALFALT